MIARNLIKYAKEVSSVQAIRQGLLLLCVTIFSLTNVYAAESTRAERRLINEGNTLYRSQKYAEAKVKYRNALAENGSSAVARFNLGLCNARLAYLNKDNDSIASKLLSEASTSLLEVAKLGKANASLASKANYNLGNLSFESEDYQQAINFYKQALRLNPAFDDARRNLRIAQLKLQNQQNNQDQDKNKDQDKEKEQEQNKEQDKQDQNKDQDSDQNKDQNESKKDEEKQNQPPQPNQLSEQAAQQILNAVENNEQQARQAHNKGEKAHGSSRRQKRW